MECTSYCVYKHTSPSGKVYIGITRQAEAKRWKNGLGYKSSPHFWNAIQKYGWHSFVHDVLLRDLSEEEACRAEQELIAKYRATDARFGYNDKSGGQVGSHLNDDAKKKISDANRQYYKLHPEKRKELADKARARVRSDDARQKLSLSKKGKPIPVDDEWRAKMIAGTRRRYQEDVQLREKATARCIRNGMSQRKAVEQLNDDGNVIARYESGKEAGRQTGISDGNIIRCCRGNAKHAGGYRWRFAIEDNNDREVV